MRNDALSTSTHSISVIARFGAATCTGLMFALPVLVIGYWFFADSAVVLGRYAVLAGIETISLFQRGAGLAITLITIGVMIFILWVLRGLLWEIAKGQLISRHSVKAIQRLSVGTACYATVIVATQAAMSSVLTLSANEGHRIVQLTVSSETLILYAVSAILLVLSAVVNHAADIQDDNEMII